MAEIVKIDDSTWSIEDGFVRFFLLEGANKAVMIDSGMTCPDALDIAKSLTDKPIMLLNTHGDGDHLSGAGAFDEIHIHKSDFVKCEVGVRFPELRLVEINDNDIIDLGDRKIKLIHIPGHTYGSMAILDPDRRYLFAGDSVQSGFIFMFGIKRDIESYDASLDKLIALEASYDCIFASHDKLKLPADYTRKVKEAWGRVRAGEVSYEMADMRGNMVKAYKAEACGFYLD